MQSINPPMGNRRLAASVDVDVDGEAIDLAARGNVGSVRSAAGRPAGEPSARRDDPWPLARLWRAHVLASISATVAIACTPALEVHTIRSPTAHFDRYRRVAFDVRPEAPETYVTSARSADVRSYVEQATASALHARGYEIAPRERADLVVVIEAGRRVRKVIESTRMPSPSGGPASVSAPANPSGLSGATLEGAPGMERRHGELDQEERDRIEGAFVIDAFDNESGELVWHGSARSEVTSGPVDYDRLRRAVDTVLASFPAHPIRTAGDHPLP